MSTHLKTITRDISNMKDSTEGFITNCRPWMN